MKISSEYGLEGRIIKNIINKYIKIILKIYSLYLILLLIYLFHV